MGGPGASQPVVRRSRLVAFYVVLAVVTAGVVAVVLALSSGQDPQKPIAGGYDLVRPSPARDASST